MLRSLWLLFVYMAFLGLGCAAPFVATLGYVWVDTFQPQTVAYILLNQFPVALVMGIAAIGTYFMFDRRDPPQFNLLTFLHLCMLVWTSATMLWAEAPDMAYQKFDVVWKTLLFSAFVPYVIRSRVQIEAFAQTYVFSLAANFVPFGLKVLVSGGGYGRDLGLQGGNTGLGEGGLLSTVCLMAVPLAIYLAKDGRLMPKLKFVPLAYWGIAGLAVVCAVGTYERSALIGMVVLAAYMWMRSKHKFSLGIVIALAACAMIYMTSSTWNSRISTIADYNSESSAYGRLLVWQWTLGFVTTHPFGGGFNAYVIDHIETPSLNGEAPTIIFGKAFHSIYFEVLGEHGIPGIVLFGLLIVLSYWQLHRVGRIASRYPELQWLKGFSDALQAGMAVFLSAGAFVGIAFQPPFWYFVSMVVCLHSYVQRVTQQSPAALRDSPYDNPVEVSPVLASWRTRTASH